MPSAQDQELIALARSHCVGVPRLTWQEIASDAASTGVVVVDMLVGFARTGPLASPRVDALVAPIAAFLRGLEAAAVSRAWRLEDAHTEDAGEFAVYPAHCVEGTLEAEPLPELVEVALFRAATRVPKNALSAFDRYDLEAAAIEQGLDRLLIVGDCTDLCIEACAMPLRLYANARRHRLDVVVLADLVDTFDAPGHPGDDSHALALYRMAQNGVRVVASPVARG